MAKGKLEEQSWGCDMEKEHESAIWGWDVYKRQVYDEWTECQRNNKRIMDKKGQQTAIYEETYTIQNLVKKWMRFSFYTKFSVGGVFEDAGCESEVKSLKN